MTAIVVELPPDASINSWPWSQYAEEYRVKPGVVPKWGRWQREFRVAWGGRTHWFKAWHYTSGAGGRGPGMYGSIEQRDVWGLCCARALVISIVRARFAEETLSPDLPSSDHQDGEML